MCLFLCVRVSRTPGECCFPHLWWQIGSLWRRNALHRSWPLTSHFSLIDGCSGRRLFPIWRNDQTHSPNDKVLQQRATVRKWGRCWTGIKWMPILLACVCFHAHFYLLYVNDLDKKCLRVLLNVALLKLITKLYCRGCMKCYFCHYLGGEDWHMCSIHMRCTHGTSMSVLTHCVRKNGIRNWHLWHKLLRAVSIR